VTDWRYFITFTGKVSTPTDDEDVAMYAAVERHNELFQDDNPGYVPHVEVEAIDNAGN
jgi:hypothetical protein